MSVKSVEALQDLRFSRRETLFAAFTLMLVLIGAGTVRQVMALALDLDNSHASQILIVPFVTAWLIWQKKDKILESARPSAAAGAVLMGLGGLGYVLASTAYQDLSLMTGSLLVSWLGGFLFTYGPAAFRTALFPLLFLFWAVPIPASVLDRLVRLLQAGSAEMAYALITLSGVPVYREGLVFALPDLVVEVAPACSGIRSAIAIFISALIAGHLFLRWTSRKLVLLCVALPVLFFKNAIRITALSLGAVYWDKRILTSSLHTDGGVVFFVLGLIMLYPVLALLAKSERTS
jgi:exosortase